MSAEPVGDLMARLLAADPTGELGMALCLAFDMIDSGTMPPNLLPDGIHGLIAACQDIKGGGRGNLLINMPSDRRHHTAAVELDVRKPISGRRRGDVVSFPQKKP